MKCKYDFRVEVYPTHWYTMSVSATSMAVYIAGDHRGYSYVPEWILGGAFLERTMTRYVGRRVRQCSTQQ